MSFKRNDIVNKQRLRDALEEDTSMGFAHNDIVTTYAMDKAIAEGGGGGGGDYSTATVTFINSASGKSYTLLPIWPTIGENELEYPKGETGSVEVFSSQEFGIPMYKGKAVLPLGNWIDDVDNEVMPITTGGVSFDLLNFNITGDGTITFSGTKGSIS